MTSKEYMDCFLKRKPADRLPCIEWATWWNLTVESWNKEGLDISDGQELKNYFGLDIDRQIWFSNGQDLAKPKYGTHYIENEKDYDELCPCLYSEAYFEELIPQLTAMHNENEERGIITWFTLMGFFWFPRVLLGIENHLYSFYDCPDLYHRICNDMTEYYIKLIEFATQHFKPQFMTFAEDMSYNLGPMLSEEHFCEFIKPYYEKIIPLLKRHGITVIVDSDGDITKMVDWLTDAGVDGILPLERQAGVDINILSKQYPDFLFIGGFDKMVMKHGREAITKEFERLSPAISQGNYLPSVDHQTPPDVSVDNYKTYVQLLKKYCQR